MSWVVSGFKQLISKTNLYISPFQVSQSFIRASVEAQSPLAIVNISSIIGKVGI